MASIVSRITEVFRGQREPAKPTQLQGVPGFAVYGGYLYNNERNTKLLGSQRWETASDILTNISVVAASVRFMMNLISRPKWAFEPADESEEAKQAAEFMESVIADMDQSWSRIVRRLGMYRYHGFGMHEWVAKKREDGKIGIKSIEVRPVQTIQRWDLDEDGSVRGVVQRDPQSGQEFYLPRRKVLYLVDDTLTDHPDGMGWFRQLVDPAERIRSLLDLEAKGFERDLRGVPVGRAPMTQINGLVSSGKLTRQQADAMIAGLRDFVSLQRKTSETGLVLDSQPYDSKTDSGTTPSGVYQWGLELLTGDPASLEELGKAVNRLATDMALIMGTDVILTGRDGEGSRALSEDKSRNLYLNANSILSDIAEAVDRDLIDVVWTVNGLPEETKPKARPEDVAFKDVKQMADTLTSMAAAGNVLAPDDPAFDMLRDLMGMPEAKPVDDKMLMAMQGLPDPDDPNAQGGQVGPDGKPVPGQKPKGNEPAKPGKPVAGNKPAKPGKPTKPVEKATPRRLYVHRKLLNADEVIAWAKAQGFATTLPPEEMHVTVLYSKRPVDPMAMGNAIFSERDGGLVVRAGGPRAIERFDENAVVLQFAAWELSSRHADMVAAGASHDHFEYQPHVTLTYQAPADLDLDAIRPYAGELRFGPEIFEPIEDDWQSRVTEKGEGHGG